MLPSVTELTYFYEVAIAGSFSRAAKKLSISQPSLSLAIKRLEKTLNVSLFVKLLSQYSKLEIHLVLP